MYGMTETEWGALTDYERGWIEGVAAYAWMRDGTLFVGTTGHTLKIAVKRFLAERAGRPA